ncbi:MAG: polysaccharide deacetylase family protein [Clostridia bacterium]|nr:polysaccharide deacetylase family protein [Clostridia bacterium]
MKIRSIAAALAVFSLISVNTSAYSESEKIEWFYKTTGENTRPDALGGRMPENADSILYLGPEGDKTVYLTFDAGYSNENVESILDTLRDRNVKGAFFILPGIIKNSPETVKRMADEGHLVCNHTTTHCDTSKITDVNALEAELAGVEDRYRELTGLEMEKYFRPPEGSFSEKTLEFCDALGYTPVLWSFAYADWDNDRQMSPEKALDKVLSQAHDGMVMLLHPTSRTNAEILPDILDELSSRGYSFGTLDELREKLKAD